LHTSDQRHVHKRNEINIWLKGSRNNINTSHFLESERTHKEPKKKNYQMFRASAVPKLGIARFAAKFAKKADIVTPQAATSKRDKIAMPKMPKMPKLPKMPKKPKRPKIGVILMRKLLTRMDDLYDMQSKILTQLIKDHQRLRDEKENERTRRGLKKRHRNIHTRHKRRHHSKR